jgi:hypothetical protein
MTTTNEPRTIDLTPRDSQSHRGGELMPKFRVTTQRTQEVVWLIDSSSEEDAEESYGEGEIIEEYYGAFTISSVDEEG